MPFNGLKDAGTIVSNGTQFGEIKLATPTPPSGTNQAIYVMRYWMDGPTISADYTETLGWTAGCYLGFSFSGNHIATSDSTDSEYDNFFGPALQDAVAPFTALELDYDAGSGIIRSFGLGGVSATTNAALSAYSTSIDATLGGSSAIDYPFHIPASESYGRSRTIVWRIYSSLVDDSVNYQCYINNSSIDLYSLDLYGIDSNDPTNSIGVYSTYTRSGTIHGDTTGTNWRPSTGVMAFPTHFLCRWPGTQHTMAVNYVGVQYATLT